MWALPGRLFSRRPVRYLFAGAIGASVHIGTVYILAHLLGLWYVYATTVGFLIALCVSFTLQKFFTFRDCRTSIILPQSSFFVFVAITNLTLNNFLMFLLVEYLIPIPALAQFFTSALVATWSYVAYTFIFTENATEQTETLNTLEQHGKE